MTGGYDSEYILLASIIMLWALAFVVEVACVLGRDFISLLRPIGAIALDKDLPCDTHCAGRGVQKQYAQFSRKSWEG